jgi:hypothetical protein
MNLKKSTLAAAVAGVMVMGVVGQAAATEYARSKLFIDNLTVFVSDDGGVTAGGATVDNFDFNLINTAFLNTVGGATTANCSGTVASNSCAKLPAAPLDAAVINATGSTILQGENTFSLNGPGAGSYANGDSLIATAQLVDGVPTSTRQIAEAEIQKNDSSASSSSEVSSTTGFTFTFTVVGANVMIVQFEALLDILADINDPFAISASAKANTEVEVKLSKDGSTNVFALFAPDGGTSAGECGALGGLTCTTLADQFDLNTDEAVTTLVASSSGRANTAANDNFGVLFGGLTDGTWTLGLTAKTSTSLSRQGGVPEPGMLALMGIGLMGLGMSARRRKVV